jgi:hypothetical protein
MQPQRRRNRIILGLLALGLLAWAALTAHPAQAADSSIDPDVSSPVPLAAGPGPYYALPAWDRKMVNVANRFVVLTDWGNAAVLDKETGLVWDRSSAIVLTADWFAARSACMFSITGNHKGWRLPAVHELTSLIDPAHTGPGPFLPTGHPFFNVQVADYWTATTNAADSTQAWYVGFDDGVVASNAPKGNLGYYWCVRGGNHAYAY